MDVRKTAENVRKKSGTSILKRQRESKFTEKEQKKTGKNKDTIYSTLEREGWCILKKTAARKRECFSGRVKMAEIEKQKQ